MDISYYNQNCQYAMENKQTSQKEDKYGSMVSQKK